MNCNEILIEARLPLRGLPNIALLMAQKERSGDASIPF
jgi:hypothetical protein